MANTPCITPNTPPNNYLQNRKPHSQSAGYFHELGGNYKIWKLTMRPHFPSFVRLARVSAGLVRLFGIFVRCLGFYYDISAITMVRASERDTNRHIGREGRRGQDQDIDFLVDKSPESLAWIWGYWRQLRLACPGMAQCYTGLQHYCYTERVQECLECHCLVCVLRFNHRF